MKKNRFFQNKYVLVTGSSSGIGHQIAKDFLDLGSFVGVHYNSNRIGAQKLLKYAEKNKCKIFKSNLSKAKDVLKLWKNFIKWSKGNIDILINNAGIHAPQVPVEDYPLDNW